MFAYKKRQEEDEINLRQAEADLRHDEEAGYTNDSSKPMITLSEEERARLEKEIEETKQARQKFGLKRLWGVLAILVIDIGLPMGLYFGLKNVLPEVYALLISGIPPFVWVLFKIIYKRKVDILGILIVIAYVVSAVISIVSGKKKQENSKKHILMPTILCT